MPMILSPLHSGHKKQVREEVKNILRFWLGMGVVVAVTVLLLIMILISVRMKGIDEKTEV